MNLITLLLCSPPAGGQSQHLYEHDFSRLSGIDGLCDCRQYYKLYGTS